MDFSLQGEAIVSNFNAAVQEKQNIGRLLKPQLVSSFVSARLSNDH